MSGHKLRTDKDCLNCGHRVEEHFCSHCGQENIEPRQPFHYLFTHFFEDLTHYDGHVWKTFRFLLLKPGLLTREYLMGRRMRYVPPVRLYIFLSFITFLLPAFLFPSHEEPLLSFKEKELKHIQTIDRLQRAKDSLNGLIEKPVLSLSGAAKDTYEEVLKENIKDLEEEISDEKETLGELRTDSTSSGSSENMTIGNGKLPKGINTVLQLDSMQQAPSGKKLGRIKYQIIKKQIELKQKGYTSRMISEKLKESFIHNIPKALFVYMPLFAFFLWLFHRKKKWWFFDHGIFTLHYFSFLLLLITLLYFILFLGRIGGDIGFVKLIVTVIVTVACFYSFFYFFRAHSSVYKERKRISRFKSVLLFLINMIFISVFVILLLGITFFSIH